MKMLTRPDILNVLRSEIARETGLSPERIDEDASFYSLGLDSISAVFVLEELEKRLKIEMNPMFFWDYPSVGMLTDHLITLQPK